jgi:TonB family protein
VKLAVLIDEDGRVERIRLISGHPLLIAAAFDAVKQWRYRPMRRDGVAVAVFTIVEIRFSFGGKWQNGTDPNAPFDVAICLLFRMRARRRARSKRYLSAAR